jgi:high-affinity Fe2+/Pb2+ permease
MIAKKIIATLYALGGFIGMMYSLWAGVGGGLDVRFFWICTACMMVCCGLFAYGFHMWEKILEQKN